MGVKEGIITFLVWVVSGIYSTVRTSYALTGEPRIVGISLLSGTILAITIGYFWNPHAVEDKIIEDLKRDIQGLKTQLWIVTKHRD